MKLKLKMTLFKSFKKQIKSSKCLLKKTLPKKFSKYKESTNWLESIGKKYDYSDFKSVQIIGRGSYGIVSCATRKNQIFALKSFYSDRTTLIVREVLIIIILSIVIYKF